MGKRLNRVRDGKLECESVNQRLMELETLVTKITPTLSDMPKGGGSTTDDKLVAYIDLKRKLKSKMDKFITDCEELYEEIEFSVKPPNMRMAMLYRYIDGHKVGDIATLMGLDERYVYKLLRKGKDMYEKEYQDYDE